MSLSGPRDSAEHVPIQKRGNLLNLLTRNAKETNRYLIKISWSTMSMAALTSNRAKMGTWDTFQTSEMVARAGDIRDMIGKAKELSRMTPKLQTGVEKV